MSAYYRVKKYRELKRKGRETSENESAYKKDRADAGHVNKEEDRANITLNIGDKTQANTHAHVEGEMLQNSIDDDSASLQDEFETPKSSINKRIQQWALKHLDTLRLNVITDILVLLREEGHETLPRTAQALLGTKHYRTLQIMSSSRETEGAYVYLGIKIGLEKIISPNIYNENNISLLIHIDGMQLYNNAQMQVWPISAKLCHDNYTTKPFVIGIYCGDSKPRSSNDFLTDFVQEATILVTNGVELHGRKYEFNICAIVADAPARAFIKYCKPPNSFYACERCVTKGISVGTKPGIKRVYPEIDCRKRNKYSFENREQPQHHTSDAQSVLLQLPKFDIVNSVVIDSMHLLFLGVMKNLLEKWVTKKSVAKLKNRTISKLKEIMIGIKKDIPCEFQRKTCDLNLLPRWKATQYRFFLLYCGSTVLRDVLPQMFYRHFLLLFVACRLLHKPNASASQCDYARVLLRKFFYLLPSLYGEQSQVLNTHYLIY